MPSVRIEDDAFSDERYEALAEHAGLADADHARGKMLRLWRQCTQETLYSLQTETVTRILGQNGVTAIVKSRLGERLEDGTVRIRGTKGRIEWLNKLRSNGKFGKKGGRPKKNPEGYPHGFQSETPLALVPALTPVPVKKNKRAVECSAEELAVAVRVLGKITSRTGVEYRPQGENLRLIVARLRDGLSETDLRAIIAYCWEATGRNWKGKPEMHEYLRPKTLFGPEKAEEYIDQARAWVKRSFPEEQAS